MAKKPSRKWLPQGVTPAYPARVCSASEARQNFPDILQDAYGEKSLTGLHRYGRILGAIFPIEAVRILAGNPEEVDEAMRLRLKNAALNLLKGQSDFR